MLSGMSAPKARVSQFLLCEYVRDLLPGTCTARHPVRILPRCFCTDRWVLPTPASPSLSRFEPFLLQILPVEVDLLAKCDLFWQGICATAHKERFPERPFGRVNGMLEG